MSCTCRACRPPNVSDTGGADHLGRIVGVRRSRGGNVIFIDAAGQSIAVGQVVVVELTAAPEAEPMLATVVIGSGQLIEDEVGIEPTGRLLRVASYADIDRLPATDWEGTVPAFASAAGMPAGWDDWLAPPGAEPAVRTRHTEPEVPIVGDFIRRAFPNPPPPRPDRGRKGKHTN